MLSTCSKGEKCSNFKFKHISNFIHPLRLRECNFLDCKLLHDANHTKLFNHTEQNKKLSNQEQYSLSCVIKRKCPKWNSCEDYSYEHCLKYNHKIRKKFCTYYDCKLAHDTNHMLKYYHEYIYGHIQISKKNYNYNLTHPIFGISDIWNTIHSFLFEDFNTINALLQTSKMVKKYIKLENNKLTYINHYNFNEKGEIIYDYVKKVHNHKVFSSSDEEYYNGPLYYLTHHDDSSDYDDYEDYEDSRCGCWGGRPCKDCEDGSY